MNRIFITIVAIMMAIIIGSCGGGAPSGQQPARIEPAVVDPATEGALSATSEASADGSQVAMIAEIPVDLSERAQALLRAASQRASLGDMSGLVIAVEEAESYDPDHEIFNSPEIWADICRTGIFEGEPDLVWTACERAVAEAEIDASDPSSLMPYYDLRGIAAALSGDTGTAITDFQFTIENSADETEIEIHESWIIILADELPAPGSGEPNAAEASRWNRACWFGTLRGLAPVVLPACERSVELATAGLLWIFRDDRGKARALSGDTQGAIDDFNAYLGKLIESGNFEDQISQRQAWIETLEQGGQPFGPATLKFLAGE